MITIFETLYVTALRFFNIGIFGASFFNPKVNQRKTGQENWKKEFSKRDLSKKLAWFHCASLGEFEQGRPVIEGFKKAYPNYQILLTFFSPSGYEVRKNYEKADIVCYLPLDLPSNVTAFLDAFKPDIAFFVKYEFWRNFISGLKVRNIPIISFSTIFREGQLYFKPWGKFSRKPLLEIDYFFVQNAESGKLLESIGQLNFTIAGDTRFDKVAENLKNVTEIPIAKRFKSNENLMVCGSVWKEDMTVLMPYIKSAKDLKFIIAPHEIETSQIEDWERQLTGKKVIRFSNVGNNADLKPFDILFIDNVGMLSSLYQYGDFAFIGGAFGKGLHNILEAATFGMPIFFGDKSFLKFQEAKDLIEGKGAFVISKTLDLESLMKEFLLKPNNYKKTCNASSEYVKNHTGATDVILNWLNISGLMKE